MIETSRETGEISCPWCGAFSAPAATCDLCGSPMADAKGVTVLSEPREPEPVTPSLPVVSIPEPALPVQPLRFAAVQAAGTARAGSAEPRPDRWVRYRRSLQVQWTFVAVNC
jgi:hypothetical protein